MKMKKKSSIFLATYLLEDIYIYIFSRIRLVKENPREFYFFLPFSKKVAIQQKLAQKKKRKKTLGESHNKQAIFQFKVNLISCVCFHLSNCNVEHVTFVWSI
jgi:hypothetical protein